MNEKTKHILIVALIAAAVHFGIEAIGKAYTEFKNTRNYSQRDYGEYRGDYRGNGIDFQYQKDGNGGGLKINFDRNQSQNEEESRPFGNREERRDVFSLLPKSASRDEIQNVVSVFRKACDAAKAGKIQNAQEASAYLFRRLIGICGNEWAPFFAELNTQFGTVPDNSLAEALGAIADAIEGKVRAIDPPALEPEPEPKPTETAPEETAVESPETASETQVDKGDKLSDCNNGTCNRGLYGGSWQY